MSHDLSPPIKARYIRFRPVEWKSWISMRVELYGCRQGIYFLRSSKPVTLNSHDTLYIVQNFSYKSNSYTSINE